jgi:HEAT repeat protein
VGVLRPRRAELGLSTHQGDAAREELLVDVVNLAAAAGACPESYDRYLELARERVVSEETLGCLLRDQQPGLPEVYLRDLQLHDPEGMVAVRKRRLAVSFLADLGEPAVTPVCRWLREGDELARRVAVRALAAHGSPGAIDCLAEATADTAPEVRASAIDGIRFLVGRGALPVERAWSLIGPLAADPDPRVRVVSVRGLALFDFEHAQQALSRMEKDPAAEVAEAARARLHALRKYRSLNPDLRY